jgi:F420-dependent oxidoreductase-like protein
VRLGLNIGYGGSERWPGEGLVDYVTQSERLGYDSVWVGESYSTDAVSVASWVAARTQRIAVGTAAMQIPARSAAITAMTAATLSMLSGGRFRLGVAVSGPRVAEGWHGVAFGKPLTWSREYLQAVRLAMAGQTLATEGSRVSIPAPGSELAPLRLMSRYAAPGVPVYLAAMGPRSLQLAGELCDGWLAAFYSPERSAAQHEAWRLGRAARDSVTDTEPFDVVATVPVAMGPDVHACADTVRPYCALYIGGMGPPERNFYYRRIASMGFELECREIQRLYQTGHREEAERAVPFALIDGISLLGPAPRVRDRMLAFAASGVTTLSVATQSGSLPERLATLQNVASCAAMALNTPS